MISKGYAACSAALIALMFASGLAAIAHTPPHRRIAIHFGIDGAPNGWTEPLTGFLLLPAVGAGVWLLLALAPRLDPRGANLARSQTAYGVIWLAATLILALTQMGLIGVAAGYSVPMPSLVAISCAALLLLAGNVMGKLRPNNFVGIRTPWTRADDRVWDKTHRFGGFMFVAGGLIEAALAAFVHDPKWVVVLSVAVLTTAILVPAAGSYVFWRRFAHGGSPA